MRLPFFKKDIAIGSAQSPRNYDLGLEKSAGSLFIIVLFSLMTYLSLLSVGAGLWLYDLSDRYAGGLSHTATIIIPAQEKNGQNISAEKIETLSDQVNQMMSAHPAVSRVTALSKTEITDLVSPWLGSNPELDDLPLPRLISVMFQPESDVNMDALSKRLLSLHPDIRIDTHQDWLDQVMRLTGTLKNLALAVILLMGGTTFMAVSGAISSKMAIHAPELELIHLMGASDQYLSRQFERYAARMACKGIAIGLGVMVITGIIVWLALKTPADGMAAPPDLASYVWHGLALCAVPLSIVALAILSVRITSLRVLAQMP
jgi:cell division transport system permease protein